VGYQPNLKSSFRGTFSMKRYQRGIYSFSEHCAYSLMPRMAEELPLIDLE